MSREPIWINKLKWYQRIHRWLWLHKPVIITYEKYAELRFRAMWHCPTCNEIHDRNQYGN